jgi:hypothetical protein
MSDMQILPSFPTDDPGYLPKAISKLDDLLEYHDAAITVGHYRLSMNGETKNLEIWRWGDLEFIAIDYVSAFKKLEELAQQ